MPDGGPVAVVPRETLIDLIAERHLSKIWWSPKSRLKICRHHLLPLAGRGAIPYSVLPTEDLERLIYELDRGLNVEPESVGKGQELARVANVKNGGEEG